MTTAEKLFQDALVLDKEGQAERAFTLYLGAAELGFVPAQLSAGVACMSGRGTAQNYEMAVFWLEKAAAQNNACAIANLAYCYCNGYGVARSETKALELYRAAANLGDSNASRQYDLLRSKLAGSASSPAAAPAEPKLTLEQVRAVLADKSRLGFTAEIRALLMKYGAPKLSGIAPENYKALLAEVEVLGDGA